MRLIFLGIEDIIDTGYLVNDVPCQRLAYLLFCDLKIYGICHAFASDKKL